MLSLNKLSQSLAKKPGSESYVYIFTCKVWDWMSLRRLLLVFAQISVRHFSLAQRTIVLPVVVLRDTHCSETPDETV